MSRKSSADKDLDRGRRLTKILEEIFPEMSRRAMCRALDIAHHSKLTNMENGCSIDNRVLVALSELIGAGRLLWLLTGQEAGGGGGKGGAITASQILAIKILAEMMEVETKEMDQARERLAVLLECLRGVAMDPDAAAAFISDRDEVALASVVQQSSLSVPGRGVSGESAPG